MDTQIQPDDLSSVLAENDHLKRTIAAMREALREMAAEKDESVQNATVSARNEISQLKKTIFALRDELEQKQVTYEENIQKNRRAARDNVKQLEETIKVLRQRLEDGNPG